MNSGRKWIVRVTVLLFASAILFWSWQVAYADRLAHPETGRVDISLVRQQLEKAISIRPSHVGYLLRKAQLGTEDFGTSDKEIRDVLQKILRLSPNNAEALMDLGLLEQRAGNLDLAERLLLEATHWDHTLKPSWTLTNFYFQTNQLEKMWPWITRCLNIVSPDLPELTRFNADPILDLCWRAGATGNQVLGLTPHRPPLLFAYCFNAIRREDLDAALLSLPLALPFADNGDTVQRNVLSGLCGKLLAAGRTRDAVNVWNQLVAKGVLRSTPLDLATGRLLADPQMQEGFSADDFGWQLKPASHVIATHDRGWLEWSFDGHEDEHAVLLSKNLPVVGGQTYVAGWKAATEFVRPSVQDSGLSVWVVGTQMATECPSLLAAPSGCRFTVPANIDLVRLEIRYERPLGAVRLQGSVRVSEFKIDPIKL